MRKENILKKSFKDNKNLRKMAKAPDLNFGWRITSQLQKQKPDL